MNATALYRRLFGTDPAGTAVRDKTGRDVRFTRESL